MTFRLTWCEWCVSTGSALTWRSGWTSRPSPTISAWLVKRISPRTPDMLQQQTSQEGRNLRTAAPEEEGLCLVLCWVCRQVCWLGRGSETSPWHNRRASAVTWRCQTLSRTTLQNWHPMTVTRPTQRVVTWQLASNPSPPPAEPQTHPKAFAVKQTAMSSFTSEKILRIT